MTPLTEEQAAQQLQYLAESGFQAKLSAAATAHGLPATFAYAISSRETNCRNILGDYQNGQARAVGLLQIDIQWAIARQARDDGTWQTNPDPLIDFGVNMLAENLNAAKQRLPSLSLEQQLKVTASGYNCGIGRAIQSVLDGVDSDVHTTGGNYGADVIGRQALFADLVAKQAPPA
jgi:hypothetical protein